MIALRNALFSLMAALTLVACASEPPQRQIGPDGMPLPTRYDITPEDRDAIIFRTLDGLNSLRAAAGAAPVQLSAELTAAAATHSRDMSVQNRPWHFGSDGSSPLDRVRRVGFLGQLTGEVISETYETETETLAAWMQKPDTRAVLLDRSATYMGFDWYQEPNGKIWWTMVLGRP